MIIGLKRTLTGQFCELFSLTVGEAKEAGDKFAQRTADEVRTRGNLGNFG